MVSVTSTTQSPLAAYTHSPFGEVLFKEGDFNSRFQFSSKEYDPLTSLNYYGYRFYSAEKGRWINRDPVQEKGGMNLYGFVENSSISSYDYLGLSSKVDKAKEKLLNAIKAAWTAAQYAVPGSEFAAALEAVGGCGSLGLLNAWASTKYKNCMICNEPGSEECDGWKNENEWLSSIWNSLCNE